MNYSLLKAFLSVNPPLAGVRARPSAEWNFLFDYYNKYAGQGAVDMSCGIYFHKVWRFCRTVLYSMIPTENLISTVKEAKEKSNEFRANNII